LDFGELIFLADPIPDDQLHVVGSSSGSLRPATFRTVAPPP